MKKIVKILFISIIVILTPVMLLIGYVHVSYYKEKNDPNIGEYKLEHYEYYLERFSSDKVLGPVENERMAKEKAEEVWIEIYGEDVMKNKKPYSVAFDSESQTWYVSSAQSQRFLFLPYGGWANIIIQKEDGKVLAVWHTK